MPGFFKSRKKLWVLGAVLLVLVVAGAGAAWFFLGRPAGPVAEEAAPPPLEHKAAFQTLWALDSLEVPLSGPTGDRTLKIGFSFDLESAALTGEMERRKGEILDALRLSLAGRSVEEMERSGSLVRLKYETLRLVNGLLDGGGVKGVFITEFLIL